MLQERLHNSSEAESCCQAKCRGGWCLRAQRGRVWRWRHIPVPEIAGTVSIRHTAIHKDQSGTVQFKGSEYPEGPVQLSTAQSRPEIPTRVC